MWYVRVPVHIAYTVRHWVGGRDETVESHAATPLGLSGQKRTFLPRLSWPPCRPPRPRSVAAHLVFVFYMRVLKLFYILKKLFDASKPESPFKPWVKNAFSLHHPPPVDRRRRGTSDRQGTSLDHYANTVSIIVLLKKSLSSLFVKNSRVRLRVCVFFYLLRPPPPID